MLLARFAPLASVTLLLLGLVGRPPAAGAAVKASGAAAVEPEAGAAPADPDLEICRPGRARVVLIGARTERVFARVCAGSPTFRALLRSLDHHAGLEVAVEMVSARHPELASASLRGETRWSEKGPRVVRSCGASTHTGRISCRVVRGAHEEAYLGHELRHALELAECGDIRRAPTVGSSRGERDLFDTERARETERAIRAELAG